MAWAFVAWERETPGGILSIWQRSGIIFYGVGLDSYDRGESASQQACNSPKYGTGDNERMGGNGNIMGDFNFYKFEKYRQ